MATTQDLIYRVEVNDTALDRLIVKTNEVGRGFIGASNAAKPLDAQLRALGRRYTEVGRYMTRNFTAPVLLASAAAAKMGYDFDKAMSRIQTLGGAAAKDMDGLKKSVLDMASSTLTAGPLDLANALYFIRSSGFGAAEGMKVLKAANEGAMIGMGDTQTVADAVTSAMNAYGHSTMTASRVTDIFAKTVQVGKAEPAELARSIGYVVTIAAQMGVKLKEVGGEIATMTLSGLSASTAVTGLRATLQTFNKGLPITQKGLAAIGLGVNEVQASIKRSGLAATLNEIRRRADAFGASGGKLAPGILKMYQSMGPAGQKMIAKLSKQVGTTTNSLLATIFPNVRAFNAFLATTGANAQKTANNIGQVGDSAGYTQQKFDEIRKQNWAQFLEVWSKLRAEFTRMGEDILPFFVKLLKVVLALVKVFNFDWLGKFKFLADPVKHLVLLFGLALVAAGPLLKVYGLLIRLSSVYVLQQEKQGAKVVALAEADRAALQDIALQSARTAEAISLMGPAMAGTTAQIEGAAVAASAAIASIGAESIKVDTQIASIGEVMAGQTTLFDASVGEMTASMTVLDAEINKVKADLLTMGIVAKEQAAGGFAYMAPGGQFLKKSEREMAAGRMAQAGEQMTLFDPRLFKGTIAEAEKIAPVAEEAATKVGRIAGAFAGVRGAAIVAGVGIRAALAPLWPLLVIELLTEIALHWDAISKATYNAVNAVKDYVAALPGVKSIGHFFSGIASAIGGAAKHIPGVVQAMHVLGEQPEWLKKAEKFGLLAGISPLAAAIKLAYDHGKKLTEEQRKVAAAASQSKDYAVQLAKALGISVAEARRLLSGVSGVSGKLSAAAAAAKSAFQDAFSQLTGDIQTNFDARTDAMLKTFDRNTQTHLDSMNQTAQDRWAKIARGFDRHTDDMLTTFDNRTDDTWTRMSQKFEDQTDKMVAHMKVTVKALGRTFVLSPGQLTPAERELKALEKAASIRQEQRDLMQAGRDITQAIAIGDPYALEKAQQAAEDARTEIRRRKLTERADVERKAGDTALTKGETALRRSRDRQETLEERAYRRRRAKMRQVIVDQREADEQAEQRVFDKHTKLMVQKYEDRRDKERSELVAARNLMWRHLETSLNQLASQLLKRQISIATFNTDLKKLLPAYGVTASEGAKLIGTSFGKQMQESLANLATVISRHAKFLGNKHKELAAQAEHAATRVTKAWTRMANGIVKQAARAVAAMKTMTDAQTGAYTGPPGGPNYGAGVGGAHGPGGPLGGSSTAYFGDVLGLLTKGSKKKLTAAQYMKTIAFFNMWAHQENVPQNVDPFNALGTSLPVGGSHPTNKYKVQAYKTWRDGVIATVKMLSQSNFKNLLMAVMSGDPLNYIATHKAARDELQLWSGTWHGGYSTIKSTLSSAPMPIGDVAAAAAAAKQAGPRGGGASYGKRIVSSAFAHYEQGGGFQVAATAYSASHASGHSSTSFHLPGERQPYDCSAFVQAVFKNSDMKDPGGTTYSQITNGHKIAMNSLLPGDLVFFNYGGERWPGHVAIYMGNGMCIHDRGANSGGVEQVSLGALSSGSNHRPEARCYIKQHVHYSQGFTGAGGAAAPSGARALATAGGGGGGGVAATAQRALQSLGSVGGASKKMFVLPGQHPGLLKQGNINLANRPIAPNPKGGYSTVDSFSINVDGKEVLIPMVVNGRVVSQAAAIKHYMATKQNLGTFTGATSANAYAVALHRQQAGYLARAQRSRPIAGIPKWLQGTAHATVRKIAEHYVKYSDLEWVAGHGGKKPTPTQIYNALPPHLISTLTAAQRRRLGPAGVANYLQKMAMAASNPVGAGLIATHGAQAPWTLGPQGVSGNLQNITINVYESGNPKKTAVEVRNALQKTAARNAKSVRGRRINEKIGAK